MQVKEQKAKAVRPFGMRDKMGYMFGDFGNDFTFILSTMILSKFYTDVMGVSAGVIGTIMMLARFVDAVTDVTMGRICDRSKVTAQGKFKPWILRIPLHHRHRYQPRCHRGQVFLHRPRHRHRHR